MNENLQANAITGNYYQGYNQAVLMRIKQSRGYKSNKWLTFLQAKANGLMLENAKGKGVTLRTFPEDEKTGENFPYYFSVFNFDHIRKD